MPKKPKIPCRYSGCAELSESPYCKKHTKLVTKHYNKYQRNPDTYKRYSNRWRRIRQLYIKEHPVCELCERKNILKAVEDENLMSLWKRGHSKITATEGGRWG